MMRKTFPLLRRLAKLSVDDGFGQTRGVWDTVRPSSDIQRMMREMDRRMQSFEREFFKMPPFRFLTPRFIPIDGVSASDVKFRVDLDLSGFQPEDVKINLKDGKIKVEAKMDKTAEDGSRVQQYLLREFTLPPNVDEKSVESLLHNNGVLTIEATSQAEGAKKLPITSESGGEEPQLKAKM